MATIQAPAILHALCCGRGRRMNTSTPRTRLVRIVRHTADIRRWHRIAREIEPVGDISVLLASGRPPQGNAKLPPPGTAEDERAQIAVPSRQAPGSVVRPLTSASAGRLASAARRIAIRKKRGARAVDSARFRRGSIPNRSRAPFRRVGRGPARASDMKDPDIPPGSWRTSVPPRGVRQQERGVGVVAIALEGRAIEALAVPSTRSVFVDVGPRQVPPAVPFSDTSKARSAPSVRFIAHR